VALVLEICDVTLIENWVFENPAVFQHSNILYIVKFSWTILKINDKILVSTWSLEEREKWIYVFNK
jgi:hypothetical protein